TLIAAAAGLLLFFFSSRRRHTTFSRDWSSDVCSSDLVARDLLEREEAVALAAVLDEGGLQRRLEPGDAALVDVGLLLFLRGLLRSEERRVGKGGRSEGAASLINT